MHITLDIFHFCNHNSEKSELTNIHFYMYNLNEEKKCALCIELYASMREYIVIEIQLHASIYVRGMLI